MQKLRVLVRAPALVNCGYGVHSRQIIDSLIRNPNYDLYLESVPWGVCAFLIDDTEEIRNLKQLSQKYIITKQQGGDKDWDIFVSVTIPNEFERRGHFNVGVTAGAETDRISFEWIQKCNEMDWIVVPSKHTLHTFSSSAYAVENKQTGEKGEARIVKPISLIPEYTDTDLFKKTDSIPESIKALKFTAPFNFLVVGQWGKGGFGEDRKNIANTIMYFLKAFQNRKDVGLVLKISMARNSEIDYQMVCDRVKQIKSNFPEGTTPPIHILHANFSEEEMAGLYNHPQIKAFLSLTHGEGFGLPLLEAAACQLPILATNWSGHLDFLKPENTHEKLFIPLDFDMQEIPDAVVWEPILIKHSRWAVVREEEAIKAMKKIVSAYSVPAKRAEILRLAIEHGFSKKSLAERFDKEMGLRLQGNPSGQAPEELIDDPEAYNVLYTMPMSTGDVFLSTGVIDGLVKDIQKEHKGKIHIYFATQPKYAEVLEGNTNIHKVIDWNESMMDIDKYEQIFDLVLTPNIATQFIFSNWVRKGHGRLLVEEFANHCQISEIGDFYIKKDLSVYTTVVNESGGNVDGLHMDYITFHPGSGKGQWEARNYKDWDEVLFNIKKFFPSLYIIQVGGADEPRYENADVDLRGKTSVHELAQLISRSQMHLSIDTFTMHLAAAHNVPLVAIFGSSHANSTGPWYRDRKKAKFILLEAEQKMGCKKACYKYQCKINAIMPCVNEVDAVEITRAAVLLLKDKFSQYEKHEYQRTYGKISGYTTSYNAITMGYPFMESIASMLGFCDEVIVIDHSTDGTYEILEKMAADEPRIQLFQREWEPDNPTQDGDAKAYARALCQYEFCWQQDLDEVVHEQDYEKIKMITKRFPTQADILHLPVVECWGDEKHATGRRHSWKWRMSRNNPNITHSVNVHARLVDEKTGQVYAKEGMSDGCEYVDIVSYEPLPHVGFYNGQLEAIRQQDPKQYGEIMNRVFDQIPGVYHYSWFDIEKKIEQFRINWDKQWSVLYQKETTERFPGIDTPEKIHQVAEKLRKQGGEDCDQIKYTFELTRSHPAIMKDWIAEHTEQLKKAV